MRLTKPRLEPLAEEKWDDETREMLERLKVDGRVFNIFRTLAAHPKLLKKWLVFGNHILNKSTLPPREREFISDAVWDALAATYDTRQLLDLIFTVGQYNLVSMALNTLGVRLDEGVAGFES